MTLGQIEEEMMHEYGLKSSRSLPTEKFDAIVLTVPHSKFSKLDFLSLKKKNAIIYDVKNFLKNDLVDSKL